MSSVQGDPDVQRRSAVKKRVAQYISKAEQLGNILNSDFFRAIKSLYVKNRIFGGQRVVPISGAFSWSEGGLWDYKIVMYGRYPPGPWIPL